MKIGVIGAGIMGRGIAQVSAMGGHKVVLYDIDHNTLDAAKLTINKNLTKAVELGKITEKAKKVSIDHIQYTNSLADVSVDLVIEAILEKIDIKLKVFSDLAEINGPNTIYASNTSSIPLTQLAAGFNYPNQMIGVHFFNPAHIMKLVEVIRAEQTSDHVLKKAIEYVKSIHKHAIQAADAPGFIVNRVARHFYVEGLKVLEESVASHDVIDDLIRSAGFKMGPFELMDLIGVETNLSVTESMHELFNFDPKFRPSRIQQKKVQAGYFGRKSGQGFYTHNE